MSKLPYYKQQTPFTCSLACLRMVLESVDRKYLEIELAKIINFSPEVGVSMPMMAKACEVMNLDYVLFKSATLDDLKGFLSEGFYPIVIIKAKLYHKAAGEHGHYAIVKDITKESVIINDPDQEYGGKNKAVNIDMFTEAWTTSKNWLLVIKGEA